LESEGVKQLFQDLRDGNMFIVEAPKPQVTPGTVLIKTSVSLISAGTERMLADFGKSSYLQKARKQPEKVKEVLNKIKTDGLAQTVSAVRSKLGHPLPLGYCNVGTVIDVGEDVSQFKKGDRVVSNGPHADTVLVPKNLCAKIPDGVSDEAAAFTVVASIGLQGIRLAQPALGEVFTVTGVGLIGLLTVQILLANGCKVLAVDYDQSKLDLARKVGAQTCNIGKGEDPVAAGIALSHGEGVDGVIITASTTSSDPVSEAAQMCRKRGRIVLVGVTGLNLSREQFYKKELSFQVSCSYGPGRYDPSYEDQGNDYPIGFVRWTEQRNFEAVLGLFSSKSMALDELVGHRFAFEDAARAYETLLSDQSISGILLQYESDAADIEKTTIAIKEDPVFATEKPVLGFIGAGNYASRILMPAFKKAGAQFHTVSTLGGVNSALHGKASGFAFATTDTEALLETEEINTVVVATRHDSHSQLAVAALKAGKNVFVEKPLALTSDELQGVEDAYNAALETGTPPRLMVGFNRRFSPHARKMKEALAGVSEPVSIIVTINAGHIDKSHWTQDVKVGGGRIIGEACHFIDLIRFFVNQKIASINSHSMGIAEDIAVITMSFEDGSLGTIHYLANGAPSFPKERVEIFSEGRVLQLDNFRKLTAFGWPEVGNLNLLRQNKGQEECARQFLISVAEGSEAPISASEIFEVARASIEAAKQIRGQGN
jgi:predicted dehydrogenase/threonine dehydrogenase-like Zn-dependent dehydrogenase